MAAPSWRTALAGFQRRHPGPAALLELGLLFLPSLPAYAWIWPALAPGSTLENAVQAGVYAYLLGGAAWIGRRRWSWAELGVQSGRLLPALVSGAGLVGVLVLARLALELPVVTLPPPGVWELAWDVLFYFGFVALTEELLFRGVAWRAVEGWLGRAAALILTSLAFGVYHIGWASPLQMLVLVVIGVILGLVRLRSGSILGPVLIHGLYDVLSVYLFRGVDRSAVGLENVAHRVPVLLADVLFFAMLAYLLFPGAFARLFRRGGPGRKI